MRIKKAKKKNSQKDMYIVQYIWNCRQVSDMHETVKKRMINDLLTNLCDVRNRLRTNLLEVTKERQ